MTARRIRDLRRLLKSVAEPFGATVIVEHTRGNHLRGTFAIGTRQVFIITGADLKVAIAQREAERSAP